MIRNDEAIWTREKKKVVATPKENMVIFTNDCDIAVGERTDRIDLEY